MTSPAPELSAKLLSMQKEICDTSSESTFDDTEGDPNYDVDLDLPQDVSRLVYHANGESSFNYRPRLSECNSPVPQDVSDTLYQRSMPSEYNSPESAVNTPKNCRKMKSNPDMWKQKIRQTLRESGQKYTNISGNEMSNREVKPPCGQSCFHLCSKNFSEQDRHKIHKLFWSLSDKEKPTFYSRFVKKTEVQRRRVVVSEKKNSFKFFMQKQEQILRVCRTFFLNTLDIDEKRIYYFFKNNIDNYTGTPLPSKKGKNVKRVTSDEQKKLMHNHIQSFPVVESHYCRASSTRKYLDPSLCLSKMYKLYTEKETNPVSYALYRNHFLTEFNLSFLTPKKDQCNFCSIFKANQNPTEIQKTAYTDHCEEKKFLKAEKDVDKQNIDPKILLIIMDLQSVLPTPKGFASAFYYKRKINVYNFTATAIMYGKPKRTYCAVWNEAQSERSGNDISSAAYKIFNQCKIDYPDTERILIWSDSCVPQNKNKIMSTTILQFMHNHPNISSIEQKFSVPGHSLLQEVDCVHSAIDRHLKNVEVHSQLSFI